MHVMVMVSYIYDPAAVHYTTEEYQNLTGNKTGNTDILISKHLKSILLQGQTNLTTTMTLFTLTKNY
jgi:hypothetical protein